MIEMKSFDYTLPAELFASRGRGATRRPMTYHRFPSAAQAICYAMETLPEQLLFGTVLETEDERLNAAEIRSLYESPDYPLTRKSRAESVVAPKGKH